ncbi:MAG: hypothetical protein SVM80_03760 [Halobacteriota archaeon]|nr:hypothetical protein [Halobacteriota archaeon]
MKNFIRSDEAVSETVAFILILAIVMISIGLIVAVGLPIIQQTRDNSQFQSMVQSFSVLQSSGKMVALENAPIKTVRMSLGEGTIAVVPDAATITVENTTTGFDFIAGQVGSIEYEMKGRKIAYECGGIWEAYASGESVELSNPRIFVKENGGETDVLISIINISSQLSSKAGGVASISIEFEDSTEPITLNNGAVDIIIVSDYVDAWGRYFSGIINTAAGDSVATAGNQVTATINYDRLIINEYIIDVVV